MIEQTMLDHAHTLAMIQVAYQRDKAQEERQRTKPLQTHNRQIVHGVMSSPSQRGEQACVLSRQYVSYPDGVRRHGESFTRSVSVSRSPCSLWRCGATPRPCKLDLGFCSRASACYMVHAPLSPS